MDQNIERRLRKLIVKIFPGQFPRLYSTLDDPQKVPVQEAAYRLAVEKYLLPKDRTLDIGFGLGYGMEMMAGDQRTLCGIDIDTKAVNRLQGLKTKIPGLQDLRSYDGLHIPYPDSAFDVVVSVDVIEHVPDYLTLLMEMVRVTRRVILLSTPNRRAEFTRPNGKPNNPWHLREWSYEEFDTILRKLPGTRIDWNFLDGPVSGPFIRRGTTSDETYALTPAVIVE